MAVRFHNGNMRMEEPIANTAKFPCRLVTQNTCSKNKSTVRLHFLTMLQPLLAIRINDILIVVDRQEP